MIPDDFKIKTFPDLSKLVSSNKISRRLRVCIATEEIVGPIANGGIASTYFDLARFLVGQGHEVTVLYLKGQTCHHKSIEHWIQFYADFDIEFVPLPEVRETLESAAPFWQNRLYAAWRWLKEQKPFDVVHTSEWRGGMYYALLAKKQGLDFQNTLFVVKTSSPHIWNRHYQMRFVENEQMLAVMYPEQMTVELADMVIGGSAHLLSFMDHIGYKLPEGRVFVQPNVIMFDRLNVEDKRPKYEIGDVVKTSEVVFFGRLEQRKGLEIFCDAIDFIVARGYQPSKITFLGKEGTRIPSYPHLKTNEFINHRAKKWPCDIEIHNDFNQHAAISYLLQSPCIAVMPSLIENSTMTVYEALVYRIPFIATHVGGTPELISNEYHDRVLCKANPRELAKVLQRVMDEGQVVASPAFFNQQNLDTWRRFHEFLAQSITEKSVKQTIGLIADAGGGNQYKLKPKNSSINKISVCISHIGNIKPLIPILDVLNDQEVEICISIPEKDNKDEFADFLVVLKSKNVKVVYTNELTLGETFNQLAECAQNDALAFMRSDIHLPYKKFSSILANAFNNSNAAAYAPMYDLVNDSGLKKRYLTMGGDMALGFFHHRALCGGVIAVRADAFKGIGGFDIQHGRSGLSQNLAVRLMNAGFDLEAIPIALYEEHQFKERWRLDEGSAQYFSSMPLFENLPLHLKKLIISSRLGIKNKQINSKNKDTVEISRFQWQNLSKSAIGGGALTPRIRIGIDETQHSIGFLIDIDNKINSPPDLIIENNSKVLFRVTMSNYKNKFFAIWPVNETKHEVVFSKQQSSIIKILVSSESYSSENLIRSLKLVVEKNGIISFYSKKGIENWYDGKPQA